MDASPTRERDELMGKIMLASSVLNRMSQFSAGPPVMNPSLS